MLVGVVVRVLVVWAEWEDQGWGQVNVEGWVLCGYG